MGNSEVYNRYFEVTYEDGVNVPLKNTTFNKMDYIPLKKGDVIYVESEFVRFLGIDGGKDKFYPKMWLYLSDEQIYRNSDLLGAIRHKKDIPLFIEVTKKFIRAKKLDSLLDN